MKYFVSDQVVLSQVPEGPIAAYLGSFSAFVTSQGYCLYSILRRVRLATSFSRWLQQEGIDISCITADHAAQYLPDRALRVKIGRGDAVALRHLIEYLRREEMIPADDGSISRVTPVERLTQAYAQYLREAQALAEATIHNYVPFIRHFP